MRAVQNDDRLHGDARRLHVDEQERDAFLLLDGGIGADKAKNPVRELRQRGPGLLAVDDIMIAFAHRFGFQRGKIGTGTRLGIALAPPIFAGKDARQEFLFLLFIAVGEDHRADHGEAEGQQRGRFGARGFFVVDITLRHVPAGAAILDGPMRRGPAFLRQDAMPTKEILLGFEFAARGLAQLGQILGEEILHFLAEFLFFRRERDVHNDTPTNCQAAS